MSANQCSAYMYMYLTGLIDKCNHGKDAKNTISIKEKSLKITHKILIQLNVKKVFNQSLFWHGFELTWAGAGALQTVQTSMF